MSEFCTAHGEGQKWYLVMKLRKAHKATGAHALKKERR